MPSYDYECTNSHIYTENRSINEEQKVTECPECGSELKRIWQSTPVVFNGKGFYSLDSKTELLKPGQVIDA